jgi:CHAT domain-containing protein/tetratricopeptide (TPR) repeat protein
LRQIRQALDSFLGELEKRYEGASQGDSAVKFGDCTDEVLAVAAANQSDERLAARALLDAALKHERQGNQLCALSFMRASGDISTKRYVGQWSSSYLVFVAQHEMRAGNIELGFSLLESARKLASLAMDKGASLRVNHVAIEELYWIYLVGSKERVANASALHSQALRSATSTFNAGAGPQPPDYWSGTSRAYAAVEALMGGNPERGLSALDAAISRYKTFYNYSKSGSMRFILNMDSRLDFDSIFLSSLVNLYRIKVDALMRSGRVLAAEAEALEVARWVSAEKSGNAYDDDYVEFLGRFADILLQQGRMEQAWRLLEILEKAHRVSESGEVSTGKLRVMLVRADALVALERHDEALVLYERIKGLLARFDGYLSRLYLDGSVRWGFALYKTGRFDAALEQFDRRLELLRAEGTDSGSSYSRALALKGLALERLGRKAEGRPLLDQAVQRLLRPAPSDPGDVAVSFRERLRRTILEEAMEVYAAEGGSGAEERLFLLAEAVRLSSVDVALQAYNARQAQGTGALAGLIREEQDVTQRMTLQQAVLANAVAAREPDAAVARIRAETASLTAAQEATRRRLQSQFPDYANVARPRPIEVGAVRERLSEDEAVLATYRTDVATYVWLVRKHGLGFHRIDAAGSHALERAAAQVRATMAPPGVTSLDDIPEFAEGPAHEMYRLLLGPRAEELAGIRTLIVVPHGVLNQVPLQVLVTRPGGLGAKAGLRFENHREIAYLIKDYAVVQVPSASALVQLRAMAPPAGNRSAFVGFGDPVFNDRQLAQLRAETAGNPPEVATRGLRLRSVRAEADGQALDLRRVDERALASLPRLPETRTEVTAIAGILGADPRRDVHLGVQANERQVLTGDYSDRRVVMFATHGLTAGQIGLSEPALALTAPRLAGIQGNGLLTSSEVMGLKLNADWVILSACNSGAAEEAGADAISGLGRAFFYAGARSVMVTGWEVESTSAQLITTETLRRQTADGRESRGESLRQAMLHVLGAAYLDDVSKAPQFAYAHPMFWAPYSLVGDPSAANR